VCLSPGWKENKEKDLVSKMLCSEYRDDGHILFTKILDMFCLEYKNKGHMLYMVLRQLTDQKVSSTVLMAIINTHFKHSASQL
jgi:hypothetical protein